MPPASLLWHKGVGVCACVEQWEHLGYRQHMCPPAMVCYWAVSFVPRAANVVSLHLGPRLSDPTLLCRAPYHPEPGFGQCRVLVIIHICFGRVTVFSGTGHGAIRNSQQSSHTTRAISLNSTFTFDTGSQSTKTF